jgi:hypothetical protein
MINVPYGSEADMCLADQRLTANLRFAPAAAPSVIQITSFMTVSRAV